MFDVIWTDPDRELVGEHRAKKEIAREQQRAKEKAEGSRSSLSTRGSSSSSERVFGFFGSRSLKKAVAPLKSRPSSNSSASWASAPTAQHSARDTPRDSATNAEPFSDFVEERDPAPARLTESCLRNEHMSYSSSRDSALSKWTDKTAPSTLSPSSTSFSESIESPIFQALGPSSFTTKNTEVNACPRTPEDDSHHFLPEISVHWDGAIEILNLAQSQDEKASADGLDFPINLFPRPNSSSCPLTPGWASDFKPNDPGAWKPPSAWKRGPAKAGTHGEDADQLVGEEEGGSNSVGTPHLRRIERELELMAAADPATVVNKLGESWGDMNDVSLYKELEMEKKRWMLSALQNMDQTVGTATPPSRRSRLPEGSPRKVLALYESQATASYLAASHSREQVYHLSPSPLSLEQFPNIHPVTVPTVSALDLPVAAGIFSAVYSLSLPSLISSQDIPHLLKRIHRCLLPGGTLHLTLIDPMPVTSSLGPVMRAWLEKHLLLNLEKSFRCVNPSKLFPHWLAECCLRGEGSVISTAKFGAIPPGSGGARMAPDGRFEDRRAKAGLRGVVGRMLWTEVWGVYVGAERWWWEEPACVRECLQMGTHWEYRLIEAVKEG